MVGKTGLYPLASGETNPTVDAGFYQGAASATGFVDANGNGGQDSGEAGMYGVTVRPAGRGGGILIASTATSAAGPYGSRSGAGYVHGAVRRRPGLHADGGRPGARRRQGHRRLGGTGMTGRLHPGQRSDDPTVDAGFYQAAVSGVSGFVFKDVNNNGVKDAGEAGIAGVVVTLSGPASLTTTTGPDGSYSFTNLAAGTYTVTETQPAGYLDGLDSRNGTLISGDATTDAITSIVVGQNANAPANNFGELLPSSVAGTVYLDKNSDGSLNNAEVGLSGVTVKLTGTNDLGNAISLTTTTAADGTYSFGTLRPGTYVLTETQPGGYTTTGNSVGTVNGVTDGVLDQALADVIKNIVIPQGVAGINYNYGEIKFAQATTTKRPEHGDTATIGYWGNAGRRLTLAVNGGSSLDPARDLAVDELPEPVPDVPDRHHQSERRQLHGRGEGRPVPEGRGPGVGHRPLGVRHELESRRDDRDVLRVQCLVHRDGRQDLQRDELRPVAGPGHERALYDPRPPLRHQPDRREGRHLRRAAGPIAATSRTSSATS